MDTRFYSDLPIYPMKPAEIFASEIDFSALPESWYVYYTDIESSSDFYERGEYFIVNQLAAAGIDIAINSAILHNIEIPYVYGGDGILACVPPEMVKRITEESVKLYRYAHSTVGATIRIGLIPISDLIKNSHTLSIKRVGKMGAISHTLFEDTAFEWIDHAVKSDTTYALESIIDTDNTGMPYDSFVLPVWQPIEHVYPDDEFAAIIIKARTSHGKRLPTYHKIVSKLADIAPRFFAEHPLLTMEKDGIFSVDFLKTDGTMKVIIAGSIKQISEAINYLNELESSGEILYGHTISSESVITFLIREKENIFAGLLDLQNGGYVAAAQELKKKIRRD